MSEDSETIYKTGAALAVISIFVAPVLFIPIAIGSALAKTLVEKNDRPGETQESLKTAQKNGGGTDGLGGKV